MEVLFGDQVPDPRDVVIICLADACGIFEKLLSKQELDKATPRIQQVRKLDLIGQAMTQAIQDIEMLFLPRCKRTSTKPPVAGPPYTLMTG